MYVGSDAVLPLTGPRITSTQGSYLHPAKAKRRTSLSNLQALLLYVVYTMSGPVSLTLL